MDFSDFEGLQNLEDKDYDTDSSHPEEDSGLREMNDEDMDEEGLNKQLMTRDAWEEDGQPSKFQADEDMGHGKHQDTEKAKKTKKPIIQGDAPRSQEKHNPKKPGIQAGPLKCLKGAWKVSGRCLEGIWKVSLYDLR